MISMNGPPPQWVCLKNGDPFGGVVSFWFAFKHYPKRAPDFETSSTSGLVRHSWLRWLRPTQRLSQLLRQTWEKQCFSKANHLDVSFLRLDPPKWWASLWLPSTPPPKRAFRFRSRSLTVSQRARQPQLPVEWVLKCQRISRRAGRVLLELSPALAAPGNLHVLRPCLNIHSLDVCVALNVAQLRENACLALTVVHSFATRLHGAVSSLDKKSCKLNGISSRRSWHLWSWSAPDRRRRWCRMQTRIQRGKRELQS